MSTLAAEEYASSLSDLTINSKPLINMLTMLAEENLEHAPAIVQAVEKHLLQVRSDIKLPVLYLIDSIVKNVGRSYMELFTQNIVSTFCSCFEKVDERTRAQMYKLRQTWNEVFPVKKLYAVDLRVHSIDPAWPITAPPPTSIHVNPRFFAVPSPPTVPPPPAVPVAPPPAPPTPTPAPTPDPDPLSVGETEMRDQLLRKQKELIELHQRKLTLELIQTKAKLDEQQKQLDKQTGLVQASQQLLQTPAMLRTSNESAQILAIQKMIEAASLKVSDALASTATSRTQTVTASVKPSESMLPIVPVKTRTRTSSPSQPSKAVPHSKDPRLAARNQQNNVESDGKPADVLATVKLEPAKSKQHITINLGCDNKNNVPNKEPRGLTKPDKVRNASKVCPPSNAVTKNHGASKSKILSPPSPSLISRMKIPRLKDASKIITVDLSDSLLSHKKDSSEDKEKVAFKKSSPSKTSSPKKKVSPAEKTKSTSNNEKAQINNKDSTLVSKKPESPRKRSLHKKGSEEVLKSSKTSVKPRELFRDGSKYEVVDSEGESPSPPPPPTISEKKQDRARFKEVKMSAKGRNYVRRNKKGESRSRSPVKSDVDLRLNGPPEKLQKLMPGADLVKKPNLDAGVPVDATKDVDLRQLPGVGSSSPGKKRVSLEGESKEQPPIKKSRAEKFDVLFGNEDVDLRRLATSAVPLQPSPPPPPIISQRSPSSSPTPVSSTSSPTRTEGKRSSSGGKFLADHSKGNGDLTQRDWSKFKGPKSPMTPSPYRSRHGPNAMPGRLDRLGRPLLFHRLSGDGSVEQRRYSNEDTDMRRHARENVYKDMDENYCTIIRQAQEQLQNGQLSEEGYKIVFKSVVEMNEINKLKEAKLRDASWEKRNMRSRNVDLSPGSDDGSLDDSAAFSLNSDVGDKRSPPCGRPGDIDERFHEASSHHMARGGRGPRPLRGRGNWQWERPQQQVWARGPQGVRPMHPQQPYPRTAGPGGPDGSYRWRQPRAPFVGRAGYVPGPPVHPSGQVVHPSGPVIHPSGLAPYPSGPTLHQPGLAPYPSGPALHPSGPTLHPSGPTLHPSGPTLQPSGPALHPSGPALHPSETTVHPSELPVYAAGPAAPIGASTSFDEDRRSRYERFSPRLDRFSESPPLPPQPPLTELPPADPTVLERIALDTARSMNIDGQPREIRFYGDTAVTMVNWDDPREIAFQRGQRRVVVDERDSFVCAFNDVYRDFVIDGATHKVRFGAPTRELHIDGKWYECYFGGAPISIEIGGKMRIVKLEGPPPQVKLGFTKRLDLCAGKINLIVNARNMVPIYLDAKPQRFDIENKPHILRFINALTTVLINGRPFDVEFGGLPKPILVNGKKHFIRFSVLPCGIRPGYVSIRGMEGGRLPSPPPHILRRDRNGMEEEEVGPGGRHDRPPFDLDGTSEPMLDSTSDQYDDEDVMPITGVYINQRKTGVPLDMLTSLMPSTLAPSSGFGYQVEPESQSQDGMSSCTMAEESAPSAASGDVKPSAGFFPFVLPNINVDELFQKLVATGIVPTQADGEPVAESAKAELKKEEEPKIVRTVDFKIIESLRIRQPGLVAILYSGIQCSSCGVRFPPEETIKYSQHLDWHFRQNRRERDNTRKAQSRKWYYDVSDWIQFEEIEDLEHRAQSWFDAQQEAAEGAEDSEPTVAPSVAVGENAEDPYCVMCHDKFEQFYSEESEEWHLRLAVRIDDKLYHPLCYQDFKDASLDETLPEVKEEPSTTLDESDVQAEDENSVLVKDEIKEEINVDIKEEIICDGEIKIEDVEKLEVEEEVIEIDAVPRPDLPSEDLTMQEDMGDEGFTEAELVVNTILDDILECSELQLFGPRLVKLEPSEPLLDGTDNGVTVVEQAKPVGPAADTTHAAVVSSIDGNVQFEDKLQTSTSASGSKIKINITKPIPARESHGEVDSEMSLEDSERDSDLMTLDRRTVVGEDSEPPPPGVETVPVPAMLKPRLEGRQLTVLPPVSKGVELSGLCSIM